MAFIRHTGCPFAEALVKSMSADAHKYAELSFLIVYHEDQAVAQNWLDKFNLCDRPNFVFDESRTEYGRWGLGYSNLMHLLHPAMLISLIRLLRKGKHNRTASGTRWQQQALFAVDRGGIVVWMHKPKHAGDLSDISHAIRTLI